MTVLHYRIGIDLGGTKIAAILLSPSGETIAETRRPTPRGDYDATIDSVAEIAMDLEAQANASATIGIGVPGSISPSTGALQNANSTWLNGRAFREDLSARLGREVRLANDANCFALSEATDGAAAGARSVFGVIIGTGTGGGLVYRGSIVDGPNAIGGEWGHNPLPWPADDERPGPACWCGRRGCMETWVSGPALGRDHRDVTGQALTAEEIAERAASGHKACRETLARHLGRLARGLAHVVNIFDPEVIVLGGGLSNLTHLYRELPTAMSPHIFADRPAIDIRPPKWGDASGVRGAAHLWSADGLLASHLL